MTPYAITITRQFGSEGREIGKQLAERLHCHYYDRSVIEQEAAQKDESLAALVALKQVEGYYKMAYPLGIGSSLKQEKMFQAQSAVLLEHAAKENCVIVGRCADYVLKERENVVNLFVRASMSYRLQRAIVNYQVDEKKAADIIMKNDKRRRNYYNYHVGEKWADLNNYDLVIRSDMCGIDNAVKCIITYIGE